MPRESAPRDGEIVPIPERSEAQGNLGASAPNLRGGEPSERVLDSLRSSAHSARRVRIRASVGDPSPQMTPTQVLENPSGWRERLSSPDLRLALMLAAGVFLIYLAFLAPGIYSLDGNSMLAVAESIVTHHGFTVPAGLGIRGLGGRIYSTWYPLLSVIAAPFVYLALLASRVTHLPFHYLAAIMALPISAAVSAATAGVVALLSTRLGATRRGAWLAALTFAFGTIALVYARKFFADPLLTFLTVSALYLTLLRSRRGILAASCFAGLAVLAKPTGIIVGPVLAAYLLTKRVRFRLSVIPGLGAVVGTIIYAAYNVFRFGHPMSFGYALQFRLANVPTGLAGLLASPGWGLMWYCPPTILAIWGFRKTVRSGFLLEALAIVAVFASFLFIHSLWYDWAAGWGWGPRYLLPTIPALCALAGILDGRHRKALVLLAAAGFLVNAPNMFSFYERYFAELSSRGIAVDENVAWSMPRSPLLHAWPAAMREVQDARRSDVREIFAQRGAPSHTIESSRALRVVAVWWWVLPIAGIPRWAGFLVALLLTGSGVWLIVRSRTEAPSLPNAP